MVASRLMSLIMERGGALDEKSASDLAMVPAKDTKTTLWRLTTDGLLALQDVPKRPDHHPQFTFHLFRAELPKLLTCLAEKAHHSLLNLRRRRRMEVDRHAATLLQAGGGGGAPLSVGAQSSFGGGSSSSSVVSAASRSGGGAGAGVPPAARRAPMTLEAKIRQGVDRLLASEGRVDDMLLAARDLHWLNWRAR